MHEDEESRELHRVVEVHPGLGARGWQVQSMQRVRPAKFFPTRAGAEAYLDAAGAEYVVETGKWEGGSFDD